MADDRLTPDKWAKLITEKRALEQVQEYLDEHMPGPWIMLFQLANGDSMTLRSESLTDEQVTKTIKNFAKARE